MFATVTFTAQQTRNVTVIPSTAVLRLHDRDWVFVPLNSQTFRRREIRAGREQKGVQEVLSGLHAGDRVVTNALQLSSASNQQ
jgi:cobalt-zinc-cadmium efflux system membrane fusion protein